MGSTALHTNDLFKRLENIKIIGYNLIVLSHQIMLITLILMCQEIMWYPSLGNVWVLQERDFFGCVSYSVTKCIFYYYLLKLVIKLNAYQSGLLRI